MNKNVKIALAVAMAALAVVLQGCGGGGGGASPGPTPTPGASQCPSSWTQDWRSGAGGLIPVAGCRLPVVDRQYANLSVASESDKGAACCAACAADSKCAQWTLKTEGEARYKDVCILFHDKMLQRFSLKGCLSGSLAYTDPYAEYERDCCQCYYDYDYCRYNDCSKMPDGNMTSCYLKKTNGALQCAGACGDHRPGCIRASCGFACSPTSQTVSKDDKEGQPCGRWSCESNKCVLKKYKAGGEFADVDSCVKSCPGSTPNPAAVV